MADAPKELLDRPQPSDDEVDVLSEILHVLRPTHVILGRVELGMPWGLANPAVPQFRFYVLARGSAVLELDDAPPTSLSAGDVALLPEGGAHRLRDSSGRRVGYHTLGSEGCTRHAGRRTLRLGGAGSVTSMFIGGFQFDDALGPTPPLGLPRLMHLRGDDPEVAATLGPTIQLLVAETTTSGPGSSVMLNRLVDVMFVQALRLHGRHGSCRGSGLVHALADRQLSAALGRIHASPEAGWTVERLASIAGMSRSAFAARFTTTVGEPPLAYLARWRMAKASALLRETDLTLVEVAERVGYAAEPSFNRAFKRHHAVGPGGYRRAHRG